MENKLSDIKEIQSILEEININEYIDTYFQKRRDYSNSQEYKELKKRYDKLYNQLQKGFSEEDKIKFDILKGIIHEMEGLDNRIAYKIGLIEGITIKNEINNN